jgi:cytochrome c-type biogenesis protein CcmE
MKARHRRLIFIAVGVIGLAVAVLFLMNALRSNLVFFLTPTEALAGEKAPPEGRQFRLGGMVQNGSVKKTPGGLKVTFRVTDNSHSIPVHFEGILPDLFREGQGVVAEGVLRDKQFYASKVLAKHDEKYMPPEAANAMKGGSYQMPARP